MKRFEELTEAEQTKRLLQSREGLVCIDCGKDLLHEQSYEIGQCDDCLRWDIEHAGDGNDSWSLCSDDEDREQA